MHPFAAEFAFTEAYRQHRHDHPALREAHCLQAMFPAAFAPIESGDLFAGRLYATPGVGKPFHEHAGYARPWTVTPWNITTVGFTALRPGWAQEVCYYADEQLLRRKIAEVQPDAAVVRRLETEVLAFWREENSAGRLRRAYPPRLQQALLFDAYSELQNAHPAFPLYRMTGPMLAFDRLVEKGLPGLRRDVEQRLANVQQAGGDAQFLTALLMAIDLVADCARYFAVQARGLMDGAEPVWREDLRRLAESLERLPVAAPASFHEAIQLILLYGNIACAYSWGRLDVALGPILTSELDSGRLTEAEALRQLCACWQLIADCGAPFDNRVIIGGRGRPDEGAADRFALLAIEATRAVLEPLPQLSLRFYEGQNPALLERAYTAIGEGRSFPMLYNDDVNIPSVARAFGVSTEAAEQYCPYGCGEYVLWKTGFGTPSGVFNISKILETVLRHGREPVSGRTVGLPRGHLRDFATFDDLFAAFADNVRYWIEILAEQQKLEYDFVGQEAAFLHFSLLYDDCLERGQGLFNGGLRHLGGTLESYGQINAADSLTAIQKWVFQERRLTADRLMEALEANFEGYGDVRTLLLAAPKYGNDQAEADAMQARVHELICRTTREQAARVGLDSYLIVIINNMANTVFGRQTMATADGRLAGASLANGNNPTQGMDRSGLTAFLNSLVRLDPSLHAGAVQNMKFGPELFSPALRPKMEQLLDGYFAKGGSQAMITVVNHGHLEAALAEPAKFPNLIVRVGGFSARFIELPRDVQEEIVRRTLHC